jgi:hypothetical protein
VTASARDDCLMTLRLSVPQVKRRLGKHRAALAIQVAGQKIQDINQPAGGGAKLLLTDSDSTVGHGTGRGGKLAGDADNRLGRDANRGRTVGWGKVAGQGLDPLAAMGTPPHFRPADFLFRDQHVKNVPAAALHHHRAG